MAYISQTISGYNPDPPPDDGTQISTNIATYDQIKTELVDPVKTLAQAVNSATSAAFSKTADYSTLFGETGVTDNTYPVGDVRRYGADPTGTDDSTTAITNACLSLQAVGGGVLDLGDGTYKIWTGESGSNTTIGAFSSLNGIEIRSQGATFTTNASYPVSGDRGIVFQFTDCTNITIGDLNGTYTGTRLNKPQTGAAMLKFVDTCIGIRTGTIYTTDYSIAVWFFNTVEAAGVASGARDVRIANIKTVNTGYSLLTRGGGHQIDVNIDSDAGSRTMQMQDHIGPSRIRIRSKDHEASNDVGLSGIIEDVDIEYVNTESTVNIGRCIALTYPVAAEPVALMRNIHYKLHIKTEGTVYSDRAFTMGAAVGVAGADIDPNVLIENITVSGAISSDTSTQVPITVDFPAAWSEGQNLSNICFRDLVISGGTACTTDLRGLINKAKFENIISDKNLQIRGNTTGRITILDLESPEIFSSSEDAASSYYDIISSNITSASNFTPIATGRTVTNVWVAGVLYNSYQVKSQVPQTFTIRIENVSGTLKHQILNSEGNANASDYATKINGASTIQATTPSVGPGTDFTSGLGISAANIILDTVAQTSADLYGFAVLEYYDGAVSTPVPAVKFSSTDINGETLNRLYIAMTDALSGAAWTLNTTNIPSGKKLSVKVLCWLA